MSPEEAIVQPVDLDAWLAEEEPRLEESGARIRSRERFEREYDRDFYGTKLAAWKGDPEGLRRFVEAGGEGELRVWLDDAVYRTAAPEWQAARRARMREALARFGATDPLCELGAGFGQNLIWLGGDAYGGELSPNARELAGLVGEEVHPFDFLDPRSYSFIRPGSSVFTCHAVEQLPGAAPLLDGLRGVRERVRVVVHFEPLCGRGGASRLDRLRDRYAEANDYNRDLVERVREAPDLELLGCERDRFGNNPLNPAGILAWRFR